MKESFDLSRIIIRIRAIEEKKTSITKDCRV